ncbi:hypothetical protein [Streptomyces sp. RTd22]|uniref:hypothetical protein n=1 Tax=Streptomyces sp. RTd22 TaxID=1841249 RepID=UPI0007C50B78|nr:hypothetical protein [Streptomyces sp. RTd22]
MATEQPVRCNRLVGHDGAGREVICGKPVPGRPLHVEINGAKALDLILCGEHKEEWHEHNAPWFSRAQAAKVALEKLFEDHAGNLFTTAEIRAYLRAKLRERDELFRDKGERELVEALQDRGKLSFAVEDLFKAVRRREEELEGGDWEQVTPAQIREYLNLAFDNKDDRLTPQDMRLIAGMPERGMPAQPLVDLYARLRRSEGDRSAQDDLAVQP